jgi:hypothetical protein
MYKNNPLVHYRTPRVLSISEIINCKNYIETQINEYLSETNAKSFTVKDIFGYENWDWYECHEPIQCIFHEWGKHYTIIHPKWTCDEICAEAYKQAGISLGHLVKQVVGSMPNKTFVISNPSGWNIVYKLV